MSRVVRVYFNRKEDAPNVWSYDFGDTQTEVNVREVRCSTPAISRVNLKASYPEPKAWLEFPNALPNVIDGVLYL